MNTPPFCAMFMSKRVLVTGATGLIGQYAVPQLINAGHEVLAVSRSGKGPGGVPLDLHDEEKVNAFMEAEHPEYLLHLAWDVSAGYLSNPNNLDWVIASLRLLKNFALNGGKRAVFVGTCFEYDLNYGYLSEDVTPLRPDSLYATAKVSLSQFASEWAKDNGLSFGWGRVFFLYGRNEKPERIVPYIVNCLKNGEKPALKYPHILRDYMHASDMAGGLIALMFSDFDGAVNIASGTAVPLCKIAEKAAEIIGCPVPKYDVKASDNIAPLILGDTRRLNNVIGFTPRVSLEEGLRDLL